MPMKLRTWYQGLNDRGGVHKLAILRSPIFLTVLGLKILAASLFASPFLTQLFIPFVNYFVGSGFENPYTYFFNLGSLNIFPYPSLMLYILALPRLFVAPFIYGGIESVTWMHMLLMRVPVLISDIVILVVLSRWLKDRTDKVLWWYWCSPILFYISYIHGQLDAVPIALLFVSLYFLFKNKVAESMIVLGLALATKTSILIVVPFILLYLFKERLSMRKIIGYTVLPFLAYIAATVYPLMNHAFVQLVFHNAEQSKVFGLQYTFGEGGVIYFVPLAFLLLLIYGFSFYRYNRDLFLMFLAFSFGIFTLLIPPMQGWYFWTIPFFIYFYLKHPDEPKTMFVLLNSAYFAYFICTPHSDIPSAFGAILPWFGDIPNVYTYLATHGMPSTLVHGATLTALQGVLLVNIVWLYKKGIESYRTYKINYQPYLIGIAGDSGSGKSTLTDLLIQKFGKHNTAVVAGDDLHKWERGNPAWQTMTHLNPKANRLHTEILHARALKKGQGVFRRLYDHHTGKFTDPNRLESKKIVVFQGLHTLYIKKMRDMFDLKIFVDPSPELRTHWKIIRDMEERGYTKEKILDQLRAREADSEVYIQKQSKHADLVVRMVNINPIESIGDRTYAVTTALEIECDNSINFEPLLVQFENASTLTCEHVYGDTTQRLRFRGVVTKTEIESTAYRIAPELWDTVTSEPVFEGGYEGLMQLVIAYVIFEGMRTERV